jgi:four helix bundle protein
MNETNSPKPYDLEERTLRYTKDIISFVGLCPKTLVNTELMKQVVRSSGSVGANYIEARESLGKKDLTMRIRICRKEVKESRYWFQLFEGRSQAIEDKRKALIDESSELLKIFTTIIEKVK